MMTTWVEEFGDSLIKVLPTLRSSWPCMAIMIEGRLEQYCQGLLAYEEYAGFAEFFMEKVSQRQ
jgi:hypothetical protein